MTRDRLRSFIRSSFDFRRSFDFVRSISFVRFRSFDFVRSISFVRFRSFDFVRSISFVRFRSFDFVRVTGSNVLLLHCPLQMVVQFVEIGNVMGDITFIFANC